MRAPCADMALPRHCTIHAERRHEQGHRHRRDRQRLRRLSQRRAAGGSRLCRDAARTRPMARHRAGALDGHRAAFRAAAWLAATDPPAARGRRQLDARQSLEAQQTRSVRIVFRQGRDHRLLVQRRRWQPCLFSRQRATARRALLGRSSRRDLRCRDVAPLRRGAGAHGLDHTDGRPSHSQYFRRALQGQPGVGTGRAAARPAPRLSAAGRSRQAGQDHRSTWRGTF